MAFYNNLNQIMDGHTTIEHSLPMAPLYNDVVSFLVSLQSDRCICQHLQHNPDNIVCQVRNSMDTYSDCQLRRSVGRGTLLVCTAVMKTLHHRYHCHQEYWYDVTNVWEDPRLMKFVPNAPVMARFESTPNPKRVFSLLGGQVLEKTEGSATLGLPSLCHFQVSCCCLQRRRSSSDWRSWPAAGTLSHKMSPNDTSF